MRRLLSFTLVATTLSACGGAQPLGEGPSALAPTWARADGADPATGRDDATTAVYAVGRASRIGDQELRRSTADSAARAEVAQAFSHRVEALLEAAGEAGADAAKRFAELELSDIEVVDRFYDTEEAVQLSLGRLEAAAFERQVAGMTHLSDDVKALLLKSAGRAFGETSEATPPPEGG